jgi:3-(3-hydroxy-phenyl)propionate hydroxylase
MTRYVYERYGATVPPELSGRPRRRYEVAIVGAGPIGLAAAIDLALHGVPSVILDDNDVISIGSRAICWAKRSLEIFDRLGVGGRMVEKGVTWSVGRVYHGDREIYSFNLQPEAGHKMPAFINLQQYYVEQYLVERCADFPDLIDLRWKNKVVGVEPLADGARVTVETPNGNYPLEARYVLACDGARSAMRGILGLDFIGKVFEERFLIADVEMKADFPSERWFWFEPTFHKGQSALLHKQPDDIYRIDLQLGWDTDPDEEKKPENVIPRIRAVVGDRPFELDWVSVYTFQCRRLERFVHGRVIFVGDSAHVVSPFGARGGNGGIQDVDNLVWKLARVLRDEAPARLLETYDEERVRGADENILNSARTTDFMTPKSPVEHAFRSAVLALCADMPFARRVLNSGRLSAPCSLEGLSLQTPAQDDAATLRPGAPCPDAPITGADGKRGFLLDHLGHAFKLLVVGPQPAPSLPGIEVLRVDDAGDLGDAEGFVARRYGLGTAYLVRPDQHVAASFPRLDRDGIAAAHARATGRGEAA